MGFLVTLFLCSVNVYNSVQAPSQRGLSYVEIWILGTQLPLLVGLVEYGVVLWILKKSPKIKDETDSIVSGVVSNTHTYDTGTMVFLFIYFLLFQITYWLIAII